MSRIIFWTSLLRLLWLSVKPTHSTQESATGRGNYRLSSLFGFQPMSRRVRCQPTAPLTLKPSDLIFVNTYLANGGSAVQAYRAAHPTAKYATCKVECYRVLHKPTVSAELARRLQQPQVVTTQFLSSKLLTALAWAERSEDPAKLTAVCRELAELVGLKVQKVEDVTQQPATRQEIVEQLRQRGLVPVESPTTAARN